MADSTYKTKDGDMIDAIVWRFYGRQDGGLVEAVLEANTGIADYGPFLPAGLLITLPAAPAPTPRPRLQLFQ